MGSSGLVKFLTTLVVPVFILIIWCSCLVTAVKLAIHRTTRTTTTSAAQRVVVNENNDVELRYYDSQGFEEWIKGLQVDENMPEDEGV